MREKPVVSGLQDQTGGDQSRFVASAADLEINLILAFELDFAIVQAPRKEHQAIHSD